MEKTSLISAGWLRALIYFVCAFSVAFALMTITQRITAQSSLLAKEEYQLLNFAFTYVAMAIAFIGLAILFRKIIDRKTFHSLGFEWKGYAAHGATGFFTGILILTVGSIVLVLLQFLFFTGIDFDATTLLSSILLFILVAFTEEIIFRGYLLNNLLQSMNKWAALAISSLAFALVHSTNPSANVLPLGCIFAAGFLLGINYIYTRNLWFGIFLHFSWNFFQGPVLGYEVSGHTTSTLLQQTQTGPAILTGGDFGFEGSIICLILTLLATALLAGYYSKAYPAAKVDI